MTEQTAEKNPHQPEETASASGLKRLDVLLGVWNTEWQLQGEPRTFYGVDGYEWLPSGLFLVHHTYVRLDGYDYTVLQLFGDYDASNQTSITRSFDSNGNYLVLRAHRRDDGVWTFEGATQRATLVVSDDGQRIDYHWEQSRDGVLWQPWVDIQAMRIKKA